MTPPVQEDIQPMIDLRELSFGRRSSERKRSTFGRLWTAFTDHSTKYGEDKRDQRSHKTCV